MFADVLRTMFGFAKRLLPVDPLPVPILRGPFRGARVVMAPRDSLRKVFGLYERELNSWIEAALYKSQCVIDVGANDGYFTFGCAAAFRRLNRPAVIFAFEPEDEAYRQLLESKAAWDRDSGGLVSIEVIQTHVGAVDSADTVTLNSLLDRLGTNVNRSINLLKIDVEGAELEVIRGARSWLKPSSLFLIEVHNPHHVEELMDQFNDAGLHLAHVVQRPLPLIGRESRAADNSWLVSQQ